MRLDLDVVVMGPLDPFFDHPILNSPYAYPRRHWELDETGQPTQRIIEQRRSYEQTARSKEMKLLAVKPWNPVEDAYAAETTTLDADLDAEEAEPEEAEPA